MEFLAEFFNAFNHLQFAKPDTNLTSPTFGVISSTAVNARVGQLALRWSFERSEVLPDSKVVIGWMLRSFSNSGTPLVTPIGRWTKNVSELASMSSRQLRLGTKE